VDASLSPTEPSRATQARKVDPRVAKLSAADRERLRLALEAREVARCRESFEYYLMRHVRTRDEHDKKNPVKRVPDKAYIRYLAHKFQHGPDIQYVAKSRQLMVSWILCARACWEIQFHPHARVCFQSKKLEDACEMVFDTEWKVARMSFILGNLPDYLRVCVSSIETQPGVFTDRLVPFGMDNRVFTWGSIKLPNGARCDALAQGAAQVESKVPSLFLSDEASLQDEWADSQAAAAPCLEGGGRGITVGTMRLPSAYGTEIATAANVEPDMAMRGVAEFDSAGGIPSIRVHYSADPDKDPATPQGAEWFARAITNVPGGFEGHRWRAHMEIDPTSRAGTAVFPMWKKIKDRVVIDDLSPELVRGWRLDSGFDWGVRNRTVWHIFANDFQGNRFCVHELSIPASEAGGVRGIAQRMKAHPLFPLVNGLISADPTIWNNTQSQGSSVVSNAVLFQREGVNLRKAKLRGQEADDIFVQKLTSYYWAGWDLPGFSPKFFVCRSVVGLQRCFQNLNYQDWNAGTADKNDLKEKIVDKQNDEFDSAKYAEVAQPGMPSGEAATGAPIGSFDWLHALAKRELSKGRNARS
jgi:hypothetical protein